MAEISYRRHRFPPVIIQHAVWLYLRFTLSYRVVEELLAERGLDISYETVLCWVLKFGPMIARRLRRRRPRPSNRWHLACLRQMAGEIFSVMCEADHLHLQHLVECFGSSSLRSGRHHKGCASAHRPATNDRPLVVASNGPVEVPLG